MSILNMKKITRHFYSDPGHGWLKVTRKELIDLGIIEKITPYSYQRGDSVYLEEDCDVSHYCNALRNRGIELATIGHNTNHQSKIRGYDRFEVQQ